ncbi:MAG: hypothetical protein ACJASV_003095 [Pseudorhodobacter sp.]|jgi:hypothetical protein
MNSDAHQPMRPENPGPKRQKGGEKTRDDRLKAALKANMARRKAQAKARSGDEQEKSQGQ